MNTQATTQAEKPAKTEVTKQASVRPLTHGAILDACSTQPRSFGSLNRVGARPDLRRMS